MHGKEKLNKFGGKFSNNKHTIYFVWTFYEPMFTLRYQHSLSRSSYLEAHSNYTIEIFIVNIRNVKKTKPKPFGQSSNANTVCAYYNNHFLYFS